MPSQHERYCTTFIGSRDTTVGVYTCLVVLLCVWILTACATTHIEVDNPTPMRLNHQDAIAILARRGAGTTEPEDRFMRCLNRVFAARNGHVTFYPEHVFVDALFPWFEPRIAPATPEDLPRLLTRPGITDTIRRLGVRYLIWVVGSTQTVNTGGTMNCFVTPGGAGCFGFVWWDKDSSYNVAIWDLKETASVGAIRAQVSGTSYLPAVVIPIPLLVNTRSTACKKLAQHFMSLLAVDQGP